MSTGQAVFDYSGAQVLVTGGTSGIGAAIAAAYRASGAQVTITGTRPDAKQYGAAAEGYRYLQFDAADAAQAAALAGQLPSLDILVNNAGTAMPQGRDENEPEVFAQALDINLLGAYRLAHACRPLLARSDLPGGASVIGMASLTALFGNSMVPGYGAAKAGLVQLTKSLAIAWAAQTIRVNAVAPGLIDTPLTAGHLADSAALAPWLERTPLGRTGRPADVAGSVLFLSSGLAGYITGQTLVIDGGYSVTG
jgi:NAD(P)-dependent dehydrogenase (short-subunit alcohol dehydrogenase family)